MQKRLDVRLLAPSENETGWDVFILDYNVDGPIGTVKTSSYNIPSAKFVKCNLNNFIYIFLFRF